ncbi:MAG: trypsin-like peptidase domain-containing protein [Nitrospinota bacterium]
MLAVLCTLVLASCAPAPPLPLPKARPGPVEPPARRVLPPGFDELAARLRLSVVHIRARKPGVSVRRGQERGGLSADLREFFDRLFGTPEESGPEKSGDVGGPALRGTGTGTGFLLGSRGEILTNHHVVEGAEHIRVRLYDGRWMGSRVIGTDPQTDLALLRVDVRMPLPGAPLGNSNEVRVGEWVLAIGNPFGLEETVTAGILSAKGRALGGGGFSAYLQTDAPIHAGNSGGPLFNLRGEVIGVNTAVVTEATGIGFAIPINWVRRLLPDLRKYGRVRRGWLGISIQDIDPELRRHFRLSLEGGVLVSHVQAKGPAMKAGLRPGDVILSLGALTLKGSEDYGKALERAAIGAATAMEIIRGGKKLRIKVTVRELSDFQEASIQPPRPVALVNPPLGWELRPIAPALAERLGLEDPAGLIVAEVDPESPADHAGVRRGDVIRSVGLQAVRTLEGFREILAGLKGPQISVLIQRGDRHFFTLLDVSARNHKVAQPSF